MTTPERDLLDGFLNGYLKPALDKIDERLDNIERRTGSLETTRAQEEAVRKDRRERDDRSQSVMRWRIATAFTAGGFAASLLYYVGLLHRI